MTTAFATDRTRASSVKGGTCARSASRFGEHLRNGGPILFMAAAFLFGIFLTAARASAATPANTWITNTAQINFSSPFTGTVTAYSNAADTQTVLSDTVGPDILSVKATPSTVSNGNYSVLVTVTAVDTSGVDSVFVNLISMGKADSTRLRNDGIAPDTTAGDSIWNLSLTIDTTVMGDTYQLPVIAFDKNGFQSRDTLVLVVTDTSEAFTNIISLGWMKTAARISGNAVTVSVGYSDTFYGVLFEYRPATGGAWMRCVPGNWSDPNPDTIGPYWGILWNTDSIADGPYELRSVGVKANGETDPSPGITRIVKDSKDSWINEWNDPVLGIHVRRHRYVNWSNDTAFVVEGSMFAMPTSAMGATDTMWVRITVFRNGSPDAPPPTQGSGLVVPGDGYYRRFEREDGGKTFDDWVQMELPYTADGLTVPEDDLAVYYYDVALGTWIKMDNYVIDKIRKVIHVRSRHFTDFAVFGAAPSTTLSNVLIYPNPFIPYDDDPQTGRPFVKGDFTTGIIFKNVTSTVDIDIFTITGRRVSTIHASNTGGSVQWDAHADDNREIASGTYIAVVRAPNGERVVKKFRVIR